MGDEAERKLRQPRRRQDDDSVTQLRIDFEEHRREQSDKIDNLIQASENNTEAVHALTESTTGVVELYADLQSAARVGLAIQRVFIWIGSLGAGGAVLAAGLHWFFDFFGMLKP